MNIWIKLLNLILRNFIYWKFSNCYLNLIEEIYYCCFFVYFHKIQNLEFLIEKEFFLCEDYSKSILTNKFEKRKQNQTRKSIKESCQWIEFRHLQFKFSNQPKSNDYRNHYKKN